MLMRGGGRTPHLLALLFVVHVLCAPPPGERRAPDNKKNRASVSSAGEGKMSSEALSWLKQQMALIKGESHVTLGIAYGKQKHRPTPPSRQRKRTKKPSRPRLTTASSSEKEGPRPDLTSSAKPDSTQSIQSQISTSTQAVVTSVSLSSSTPLLYSPPLQMPNVTIQSSSDGSPTISPILKGYLPCRIWKELLSDKNGSKEVDQFCLHSGVSGTHENWFKKHGELYDKTLMQEGSKLLPLYDASNGIAKNKADFPAYFSDYFNNSVFQNPEYLASLNTYFGGIPAFLFYPDYDNSINASTSPTDMATIWHSQMEKLYPGLGSVQVQQQNQSQSVISEVHTNQHLIIQLPEGSNITSLNILTGNQNQSGHSISGISTPATLQTSPMPLPPTTSSPTPTTVPETTLTTSEIPPLSSSESPAQLLANQTTALPQPTSESSSSSLTTPFIEESSRAPIMTSAMSSSSHVTSTTRPPFVTNTTPMEPLPTVYSCEGHGVEMLTNFVNPSYPYRDNSPGICIFRLTVQPGVCQIRVDVVETSMSPPVEGVCRRQFLTVQGSIWPLGVKKICGTNVDNHFYVEIMGEFPSPFVEFAVSSEDGLNYRWGLWITQIDCLKPSALRAPEGCFQFFWSSAGVFQSYSFDNEVYYVDQHYRICIAARSGICSVSFSANSGEFMLEKYGNIPEVPFNYSGMSSLYCVRDYLRIPEGSSDGGSITASHDRYCGGQLSHMHGSPTPSTVTSRVSSRILTLDFHAGIPHSYISQAHGPGFKKKFEQNQCPMFSMEATTPETRWDLKPFHLPPPPLFIEHWQDHHKASDAAESWDGHLGYSNDFRISSSPERQPTSSTPNVYRPFIHMLVSRPVVVRKYYRKEEEDKEKESIGNKEKLGDHPSVNHPQSLINQIPVGIFAQ